MQQIRIIRQIGGTHTHTHVYIYTYIYIYTYKQREREILLLLFVTNKTTKLVTNCLTCEGAKTSTGVGNGTTL